MEMVHLQIQIFLLLAIGWFFGKKGFLTKSTTAQLNSLVMNLILPCSIFRSFQAELDGNIWESSLVVLILSIVIQLAMVLIAKTIWKWVPGKNLQTNLDYGTVANNAGTLGMVVSEAAFGASGLLYSSIYMIPVRVVMWSYGIALYSSKAGNERSHQWYKVLLHPCLIAIYLGIAYMLLAPYGFALPGFAQKTVNALANCNTALVMLVIGVILSEIPLNKLADKYAIIYSVVRLIVLPALVFAALKWTQLPSLAVNICILETAMPAPVTMAMMAQKYNKDEAFASRMIFISTLASLVTLPVWTWLFSLPFFA